MSCLLCCFQTLSCCGFRNCLLGMTAFHPPKDDVYQIRVEERDPLKGIQYKMVLKDPKGQDFIPTDVDGLTSSYYWIYTRTNKATPALFIKNEKNRSNYVILYSHGNSTDLGKMRLVLQEIALTLNVHVFAYEYQGYGPTEGKPNDLQIIFDIQAAYVFLTERLKFRWDEIVLYGRSIGSGPTLYLASHPKYPVIGVILHSPIASGLRIIKPKMKTSYKNDIFPNVDFAEHVKAYLFVIHGQDDVEVPIDHGKMIVSKAKNTHEPWWVDGGTHNDIDCKFRRSYFIRISKFLKSLRDFNLKMTEEERVEYYKVEDWHKKSNHIYFTKAPKLVEKSAKKKSKLKSPTADYYATSFASNASFLTTGANVTNNNITYTNGNKNNNLESLVTLGDQTTRRSGLDTNRSHTQIQVDEDKKIESDQDNKNSSNRKGRNTELEMSFSQKDNVMDQQMENNNDTEQDPEVHSGLNDAHLEETQEQQDTIPGPQQNVPLDQILKDQQLTTLNDDQSIMQGSQILKTDI